MRKLLWLVMAVTVFAAGTGYARLGETAKEITERYGPEQKRVDDGTNAWTGRYHFKEYDILVFFVNGRSAAETVRPTESRRFANAERDALMQNIGGEGKWISFVIPNSGLLAEDWRNDKTGAVARVQHSPGNPDMLMIQSKEFMEGEIAKKKAQDKAKADGF